MSSDGKYSHAARGAETRSRGWQGAGVDDVQVDGVPRREWRWGAGETEGCYDKRRLLMEGGRSEGEEKTQKQLRRVGRIGARTSVKY